MTRDYVGRVLAITPQAEVDLKLYLYADAGFGIRLFAGVLEKRLPLLSTPPALNASQQNHLAEHVLDREMTIRVHRGMNKSYEYAVELIDRHTGVNHNETIRGL